MVMETRSWLQQAVATMEKFITDAQDLIIPRMECFLSPFVEVSFYCFLRMFFYIDYSDFFYILVPFLLHFLKHFPCRLSYFLERRTFFERGYHRK
ncbi:unnamed protein product [Angiostrongylus costaricensis]|uniref:BAR domain-containing protein n=1 Tax=Angiostrongylus costaricensis TaxID=334426 RepID=A0A0R3PRF5_ANGCS|nr:unnamed protein product [Angiostrongylus costaricensis]